MLHFNDLNGKQRNDLVNDIFEYFTLEELQRDVPACWAKKDASIEYCSFEFIKGGNFLIYREDIMQLFDNLNIEYSENIDIWDQYVILLSDAIVDILS